MKVIELINKIHNKEKIPLIKYFGRTLKYNYEDNWFEDINDVAYCKDDFSFTCLNDEVEIIEEDKKIETIDYIGYGEDGDLQYQIIDKINEIIDKLNEEK